uniref:Homeobox protein NANOG n=1 Tax=Marmota marmota marmota TaxID=9994 RepID=A0A8C5Z158_MARMA
MSSAEMPLTETAVSPSPSSMDLLIQDSPDSSTSPKVKPSTSVQESTIKKEDSKIQVKKQKMRTVFSQTQLCILNDRFQKQKYLSLQQMQELSSNLNLSYKQVKTWFQNQRMKCKRWQKNNWERSCSLKKTPILPKFIYKYVCIYVYIYICILSHTHTHTHTHTYIYIHFFFFFEMISLCFQAGL